MDILWKYNGATGEYEKLELSIQEILLMCSLFSSSDVVAAVSIVKYELQPKLYSLVFGEGISNDAVSIILFNTVLLYSGSNSEFTSITPLLIFGDFLELASLSLLVGIVVGVVSALCFSKFRLLSSSTIVECNIVFCVGYLSYCVSELINCSGIISLLTCGIIMSRYTWHNLSP